MVKVVHSRTFKSGNSVAVRLPKDFGIAADTDVELSDDGRSVTIRRKAKMTPKELLDALRGIGPSLDGVQKRQRIIFPKRPGL